MLKRSVFLFATIIMLVWPVDGFAQSTLPPNQQSQFCNVGGNDKIKIPCVFSDAQGPAGSGTENNPRTFAQIVITIINIALGIVGSLAVLLLILGGFRYLFAAGNEERAEMAKKTISHAIIGLAIVLMSFAIVALITRFLVTGTPF